MVINEIYYDKIHYEMFCKLLNIYYVSTFSLKCFTCTYFHIVSFLRFRVSLIFLLEGRNYNLTTLVIKDFFLFFMNEVFA